MKSSLTLLFLLFSALVSSGQNIRLENKVIDHEGNPLPFAYIIGKSTSNSTVSDANGRFSFLIQPSHLDSNFIFSYLGFKPLTLNGRAIQKASKGIQLHPSAIAIDLVEIKPTKMESVESLLRKIRKNIANNYPSNYYRLKGYYREALREKGEFVRYADASVELELHPYENKKYKWKDYYQPNARDLALLSNISAVGCERLHRYHFHTQNLKTERARIINSRASIDNGKTEVKANIEGGPISIFLKDELKYKSSFLNKKNLDYFDFTIQEIKVPHHGWVFQLKFQTKLDTSDIIAYQNTLKTGSKKEKKKAYRKIKGFKGLEGVIWVNKQDFAILHLDYRIPKNHKEFMCTCGPMTINHFDFHVVLDYEKRDGKYLPVYIQHQDEFIVKDTNKNEVIPYLANSEFYLTNQNYNITPEIKPTEAFANMDANQLFDYPLDYDADFWKMYHSTFLWSKVPDSLAKSISKDTALEAQYKLKNRRDTSLKPPIAAKKPVETNLHGHRLIDDYAWMKDVKNPKGNEAVINYLKAENRYTENYFIPLRKNQRNLYKELLSRIDQTYESLPTRIDEYYYSSQYLEEKEYPIYRRKKLGAAEWEVILDVNELAEDLPYYKASGLIVNPSQDIMAVYENTDGSDKSLLKFRQIEKGIFLNDSLSDAADLVWLTDSTFLYTVQEKKTNRIHQVKYHQLFQPQSQDSIIFEEKDFMSNLILNKSRSKQYIYLTSSSKISNEIRFMKVDSDSLKFNLIAPKETEIFYDVYDEGDNFFIFSNRYRENFELRIASTNNYAPKNWKPYYSPKKEVILQDYLLFPKHLVVIESDVMKPRFRIMNRESKEIVELPFEEDVFLVNLTNNDIAMTDSVTYSYQSMKEPRKVYRMDLSTQEKRVIKEDTFKYIPNNRWIVQKRVFSEAEDGTKIPITLLYRKYEKNRKTELKKTYLTAYGSYGNDNSPGFNANLFSLVNRGFIVAIAHVRGGGELGKKWHDEGKMMDKKNTFTDFISCTEYLIDKGYAIKGNIVASGGSAGGLLMGAVANMRPDLYHTIILDVPFVDVTNTMLDDQLPLTTLEYVEWGNPQIKEEFEYIQSYSPYNNVATQDYPNLLFFTAINDNRVGYWEPAKMVAKLRAHKTDDNLLLLKINLNAGHGGGSGRFSGLEELAYKYALIFELLSEDFIEKLED